jgi:hypothetical protein
MLKLDSISHDSKNLSLSTYFQFDESYDVIHTYSLEHNSFIETVNSLILSEIMKIDFEMMSFEQIKSYLKDFFVNLNWKLYPKFEKINSLEHGISLLYVHVEGDKILVVQFGRMLCGVLRDDKIITIGSGWDNFIVKSKSDLNLIGFFAKDISFKIYEFELLSEDVFFCLPAKYVEKLQNFDVTKWNIVYNIEKLYREEKFPYSVISKKKSYQILEKKWFEKKNARISASILLLLIFFSGYYGFFGNNEIENQLDIQKKILNREIKNIDLDKIAGSLNLKGGLLLIPKKNISLNTAWVSPITFPVTYRPLFDTKNFYFISHDKIICYQMKTESKKWISNLSANIISVKFIGGNKLLARTQENLFCIEKNTGKVVWKFASIPKQTHKNCEYSPRLISYKDDKRLLKSILLVPGENKLFLLNTSNGDTLNVFKSAEKICYISDFDDINKSIYLYMKNKIVCLKLKIRY